ncbi:peptidase C39 [Burkholderia ubonensis]|uniref:Peptidase C39 n=1 Tax=Burkholderia ubonensis subsp. mesacidophila TaxID=265293 RepID=A0A2A4F7H3_9BURK|nr:peptidase C39 [Burkholderia ubonensis]PCE28534.1 peptidase C39 [Burkholderia ubonensis subsp. mesacidophila]
MKRYLSPLCLAWCATMCGYASSAVAAENAPGALNALRPFDSHMPAPAMQLVDDDVLAHQTGKFADASMISGVVVNLVSQWQLPNGARAIAQGTLTAATNAANRHNAHVTTLAKVVDGDGAPSGADPHAVATGGQAVSVNGISQVTQVAGNNNAGTNTAVIDFNAQNPSPAPLPGSTSNTSAFATDTSSTVKAGASFTRNGVSLVLQTPAGIATQSITPAANQQAGSIAQLLQVAGNRQIVSNQLQILLQTQQMSPATLRQMGVLQALQNSALVRR